MIVKFRLLCLVGMILSFIALFQFTNEDQITLSIYMFTIFGCGGVMTISKLKGAQDIK